MKFSENILNLLLLILIIGLSVAVIGLIGLTSFANKLELITFTPYFDKMLLLVLFTVGLLGNYISIYKLWKSPESLSNNRFAIIYSLILIVTSIMLLIWISDMESILNSSFNKKRFPNDVDEIIFKLRTSFLHSVFWIFSLLGSIGIISFLGVLFLQKSHFKRFFNI